MQAAECLLRSYLESCYDVRLPGGKRSRLRVGNLVPADIRHWVESDWPLAGITAYNPLSQLQPVMENRRRLRELAWEVETCAKRLIAGVGHVPGLPWREPFLLVAGANAHAIDRLARTYQQNAILWADEVRPARLRVYSSRPELFAADDSNVDWLENDLP